MNRHSRNKKRYSRDKAVAERYDNSRSTIWRWANDPRYAYLKFPKPIKIGPGVTAWDDDHLDQFDARRAALTEDEAV